MDSKVKEKILQREVTHYEGMVLQQEKESLKDEMRNVLEEARMVLPGMQALLGFQTMGVFNSRFVDIADTSKFVYIIALGLLVITMGMLMTPAAYHRLAEKGHVSHQMLNLSSSFITAGMIPLMLALALDVYVVVVTAFDCPKSGIYSAIATILLLSGLWFVLPLTRKNRLQDK